MGSRGRTEETDAHGLGDLNEFAAIGWKCVSGGFLLGDATAGEEEGIRFWARLMNWMPSFRNSRGTSSIS